MTAQTELSLVEPTGVSPVEGAVGWVGDTLLGGVAITLCVLAVAFVGLLMLSGRVPVREGFRVVLGCFVLLGAPVIAVGLMGSASEGDGMVAEAPEYSGPDPRRDLERKEPDPYGGASLRR
jgi:type IV secretory pathway VirB2 component (pilin)